MVLALVAGAFWAAYILISSRVGQAFEGGWGLALAMVVAAALMVAPGIAVGGRGPAGPRIIGVGFAVAMLSSLIPYSLELEALRRLPVGVFGVLMSLEPGVAALVGLVALEPGTRAGRGRGDRAGDRRERRGAQAARLTRADGGCDRRRLADWARLRRAATACAREAGPGGTACTSTRARRCRCADRRACELLPVAATARKVIWAPVGNRDDHRRMADDRNKRRATSPMKPSPSTPGPTRGGDRPPRRSPRRTSTRRPAATASSRSSSRPSTPTSGCGAWWYMAQVTSERLGDVGPLLGPRPGGAQHRAAAAAAARQGRDRAGDGRRPRDEAARRRGRGRRRRAASRRRHVDPPRRPRGLQPLPGRRPARRARSTASTRSPSAPS